MLEDGQDGDGWGQEGDGKGGQAQSWLCEAVGASADGTACSHGWPGWTSARYAAHLSGGVLPL